MRHKCWVCGPRGAGKLEKRGKENCFLPDLSSTIFLCFQLWLTNIKQNFAIPWRLQLFKNYFTPLTRAISLVNRNCLESRHFFKEAAVFSLVYSLMTCRIFLCFVLNLLFSPFCRSGVSCKLGPWLLKTQVSSLTSFTCFLHQKATYKKSEYASDQTTHNFLLTVLMW